MARAVSDNEVIYIRNISNLTFWLKFHAVKFNVKSVTIYYTMHANSDFFELQFDEKSNIYTELW